MSLPLGIVEYKTVGIPAQPPTWYGDIDNTGAEGSLTPSEQYAGGVTLLGFVQGFPHFADVSEGRGLLLCSSDLAPQSQIAGGTFPIGTLSVMGEFGMPVPGR